MNLEGIHGSSNMMMTASSATADSETESGPTPLTSDDSDNCAFSEFAAPGPTPPEGVSQDAPDSSNDWGKA